MRILVVDDEREMTALLARGLTAYGHHVLESSDGIEALNIATTEHIDLAVLDVMLPGMSGFELSRRLKDLDAGVAVILLTARDAIDDRVRGLDSGADDYMVKPFDLAELAARIRAVRRRDALHTPTTVVAGALSIDLLHHRVLVGERTLQLSRTEFDVLRVLATAHGETVTRVDILGQVWETGSHIDPNIVDQYVSYLRRKLDGRGADVRITTVRGVGFRLDAPTA